MSPPDDRVSALAARISNHEAEIARLRDRSHDHADKITGQEGRLDLHEERLDNLRRDTAESLSAYSRDLSAHIAACRGLSPAPQPTSLEANVSWSMLRYVAVAMIAAATLSVAVTLWVLNAVGALVKP